MRAVTAGVASTEKGRHAEPDDVAHLAPESSTSRDLDTARRMHIQSSVVTLASWAPAERRRGARPSSPTAVKLANLRRRRR